MWKKVELIKTYRLHNNWLEQNPAKNKSIKNM